VEAGAEREAVGRSEAGARRLGVEGEAGASGPRRSPGDARRQARLEPVEKIFTHAKQVCRRVRRCAASPQHQLQLWRATTGHATQVGYAVEVSTSEGATPVKFDNPPVVSVTLTLFFEPIPNVQASHFSLLREKWRASYPNVAELPPMRRRNRDGEESKLVRTGGTWPLPYTIFTSENDCDSIAFQNDRLVRSWNFHESSQGYPGFQIIFDDMTALFTEFEQVVHDETDAEVCVTGSRCDYTNHLDEMPLAELFLGLATQWRESPKTEPNIEFPQPEYAGVRLVFSNPGDLPSSVVQMAVDKDEDGTVLGFVSDFTLSEPQSAQISEFGGIGHAHDQLIKAFTQYTSASMQANWKRKS